MNYLQLFWILRCVYLLGAVINSVVYQETTIMWSIMVQTEKKYNPGKYEKVDIRHSWNAPHGLFNYLLFKLQRHSDHYEILTNPTGRSVYMKKAPIAIWIYIVYSISMGTKIMV
ncbi:unnamed protein product [Paramecium octaurelia]|uniref:Uncharacterized protein n=1 Tax=Paramecium octaurelia TaxID=43137 RepID=A0A8S1WSW7_PAROT|nr:unnamed protein product [Paramecium octaurelia]